MSDHTPTQPKIKQCSKGDACCHPEGAFLPATTEYFYPKKNRGKIGLTAECRECVIRRSKKYTVNNHEIVLQRRRQYRNDHRSELNARARELRQLNPEKAHDRDRRNYYRNKDKINARVRQWKIDNIERYKARNKKWYAVRREKQLEKYRYYYQENKERIKRNVKTWSANHLEKRRVYSKKYTENNPEKRRETQREYYGSSKGKASSERNRARRKGAEGQFTYQEIDKVLEIQEGRCLYCSEPLPEKYHIDHFIPISRTGWNSIDNLALTCGFCNLSKGNKLPWEWDRWNGEFPVEWRGRLL